MNYAPRYEDVCMGEGITPSFSTLELDGGEWSVLRPCRFTSGKGAAGTHCTIGGWVGPRGGLDSVENGKFLARAGKRTPAVELVVRLYTD
jgi:hypothetical protein